MCIRDRGGTSKGLIFLAEDLPNEPSLRDQVLLAAMGSPDARQIDGVGGTHPLTSKVGIISRSTRPDADEEAIDVSQVDVSMNGIELQDREFIASIREGREPRASLANVLPAYQVMHELEQQLNTQPTLS